jgi:hypothetical protein
VLDHRSHRFWLLAVFLAVFAVMNSAKAQEVQSNAPRMTLECERYSFAVGETVKLKVTLINESDRPIFVPKVLERYESVLGGLEIEVLGRNGNKVPLATQVADVFSPPDTSSDAVLMQNWIELMPGYSYANEIYLDPNRADFPSSAGRYQLKVILHSAYPRPRSSFQSTANRIGPSPVFFSGTATSNVLKLTVFNRNRK